MKPARIGPVHAMLASDFRVMVLIVIMGQIPVDGIVKGDPMRRFLVCRKRRLIVPVFDQRIAIFIVLALPKLVKRAAGFFIGFLHHSVEQTEKSWAFGRVDLKKDVERDYGLFPLSIMKLEFPGGSNVLTASILWA
ncbi:hypothetical protein [Serratia sp. CY74008]|uniref:hypothetical protein n=1 Tax=Serratia sp. CY74008 TaxID=3383674 RepID=UPI003FA004AF